MTAVVKINIDELDNNFVEQLKIEFAYSSLDIRYMSIQMPKKQCDRWNNK